MMPINPTPNSKARVGSGITPAVNPVRVAEIELPVPLAVRSKPEMVVKSKPKSADVKLTVALPEAARADQVPPEYSACLKLESNSVMLNWDVGGDAIVPLSVRLALFPAMLTVGTTPPTTLLPNSVPVMVVLVDA